MSFRFLVSLLCIVLIILFGAYWQRATNESKQDSTKRYILCTTTIIGDAIQRIAQNTINLKILIPADANPHLYKLTKQDLHEISQAQIVFYNGLGLEASMNDFFSTIDQSIAISKDMPLVLLIKSQYHSDIYDPHVWLDPMLWIYSINTISKTLQKFLPEHAAFYETNTHDYIREICQTYEHTKALLLTIPLQNRILITTHDAFSYFARAYECKVLSIDQMNPTNETESLDSQTLINFIYRYNIPTIFTEKNFTPTTSLQAIQHGVAFLGHSIQIQGPLYSDTLNSPDTTQTSYCNTLSYNVTTMVNGLLIKH